MNKIIRKKILTFEKLTSNNFREVSQACSSMLVFEMNFQITVLLLVLDLLQAVKRETWHHNVANSIGSTHSETNIDLFVDRYSDASFQCVDSMHGRHESLTDSIRQKFLKLVPLVLKRNKKTTNERTHQIRELLISLRIFFSGFSNSDGVIFRF